MKITRKQFFLSIVGALTGAKFLPAKQSAFDPHYLSFPIALSLNDVAAKGALPDSLFMFSSFDQYLRSHLLPLDSKIGPYYKRPGGKWERWKTLYASEI